MSRSAPTKTHKMVTDRNEVLTFGQFKGFTVGDVLETRSDYLLWLHHNTDFELNAELLEEAETAQIRP